jgi:hypothetical protein
LRNGFFFAHSYILKKNPEGLPKGYFQIITYQHAVALPVPEQNYTAEGSNPIMGKL